MWGWQRGRGDVCRRAQRGAAPELVPLQSEAARSGGSLSPPKPRAFGVQVPPQPISLPQMQRFWEHPPPGKPRLGLRLYIFWGVPMHPQNSLGDPTLPAKAQGLSPHRCNRPLPLSFPKHSQEQTRPCREAARTCWHPPSLQGASAKPKQQQKMPTEGKMLPLVCKDLPGCTQGSLQPSPMGTTIAGTRRCWHPGASPTPARPVLGTGELCGELLFLPDLHSLPDSIPFSERSTVRAKAQWSRRLLKLIMAF